MNSITLTALEDECPLNSFSFLAFMTIKMIMPKITKPNVAIVYHFILQVHSISYIIEICSCLDTTSAHLICCKAILVTRDFNFVCLHTIYITTVVTTNDIIAVKNRKTSII